jgi:hypothetical protein
MSDSEQNQIKIQNSSEDELKPLPELLHNDPLLGKELDGTYLIEELIGTYLIEELIGTGGFGNANTPIVTLAAWLILATFTNSNANLIWL